MKTIQPNQALQQAKLKGTARVFVFFPCASYAKRKTARAFQIMS